MIRRHPRTRLDERGAVTAFTVVFASAIMLLAGLVFDGGAALNAKRAAMNNAEGAARAGAQALDVGAYRADGIVRLNPTTARRAALDYIAATGDTGTVSIDGDNISVTVDHSEPTKVLSIVGMNSIRTSATGSAVAARGVAERE